MVWIAVGLFLFALLSSVSQAQEARVWRLSLAIRAIVQGRPTKEPPQ